MTKRIYMIGFRLIKRSLQANALFSFLSGLSLIILSKKIAIIFAVSDSLTFSVIGGLLILFSIFVYWVSSRKNVLKDMVKVITGLDIIWVLGSVVLIVTNVFDISLPGLMMTSMVALIVAIFAFLQHMGLKAYIQHLPEGRKSN